MNVDSHTQTFMLTGKTEYQVVVFFLLCIQMNHSYSAWLGLSKINFVSFSTFPIPGLQALIRLQQWSEAGIWLCVCVLCSHRDRKLRKSSKIKLFGCTSLLKKSVYMLRLRIRITCFFSVLRAKVWIVDVFHYESQACQIVNLSESSWVVFWDYFHQKIVCSDD